jgi:hypothetical protein
MFQIKVVKRINTHFRFNNLFPKIVLFMRQRGKCGTAGQATDDNITWRMHTEYRITKATNKPSEYVMLIDFPWQ